MFGLRPTAPHLDSTIETIAFELMSASTGCGQAAHRGMYKKCQEETSELCGKLGDDGMR